MHYIKYKSYISVVLRTHKRRNAEFGESVVGMRSYKLCLEDHEC